MSHRPRAVDGCSSPFVKRDFVISNSDPCDCTRHISDACNCSDEREEEEGREQHRQKYIISDYFCKIMETSNLPEHEQAAFKEVFSLLDVDGKGQVKLPAIKELIKSLGQCDPTDADVQELIDKVDVEKKGGISYPQFLRLMEMNAMAEDKEISSAFKLFETDGAGISSDVFHKLVQKMGHDVSKDEVQNMIRTVSGGDTLDFETFKKMMNGQIST